MGVIFRISIKNCIESHIFFKKFFLSKIQLWGTTAEFSENFYSLENYEIRRSFYAGSEYGIHFDEKFCFSIEN